MEIAYEAVVESDFKILVELRLEAMRESLEAIGRFNRERSIERFRVSFSPEQTRKLICEGKLVGFYTLREESDHLYLYHLYIDTREQSKGFGSAVLSEVIRLSGEKDLPIRLGALRSSRSNEFYARHGFVVTHEDEFDIYYERVLVDEI